MQKWKKQPGEFTQKKAENKARQAVYDALKNADGKNGDYPEVTIDGKTVRITRCYFPAFHSGYALVRSTPRRGIGIHLAECNFNIYNADSRVTVKTSYGQFAIPHRDLLAFVISDEALAKAAKFMEANKKMTLKMALSEVIEKFDYR